MLSRSCFRGFEIRKLCAATGKQLAGCKPDHRKRAFATSDDLDRGHGCTVSFWQSGMV